jgi:hypothetical protein
VSDRTIAKNRIHKGLTAHLRQRMREVGVSLDEEMAQFILGGVEPFTSQLTEYMVEVVNETFGSKRALMKTWEEEHPNQRPFAPSFPERVLPILREAIRQALAEDGNPAYLLEALVNMCVKELETSPVSIDPLLLAED